MVVLRGIRCGSIIIEQGRNAGRCQKVQRVLNKEQPWLGFTRAEALAPPQTQPDCPVGCARGLERPDPAGDRAAALAQRRTQLFGVPILRVQDESQLSLGAPADRGTRTDPSRGHVPHAVAPGGRRGSPVSGVAPGGAYERGGRGSPTRAANEEFEGVIVMTPRPRSPSANRAAWRHVRSIRSASPCRPP